MKPRKASWVVLLALLLLSLQLEARVHPLVHVGERLRAVAEQGTVASGVAMHCAECDLLSGGGDTPASAFQPFVLPVEEVSTAPVRIVPAVAPRPVPYRSRAPPALR